MFIHEQRQLETKRSAQPSPVPAPRSPELSHPRRLPACLPACRGEVLIVCAQLSFHRCLGPDNGMGCSHPGAVLAGSGFQVVWWVIGWVQKQEAGLPPAAPQLGPWGLLFVEGGRIKGLQCPLSPPTWLCELKEDKGGLSGTVTTQPNSPLIHIVGACGVGVGGERHSETTEAASNRHFQDFGHICVHLYIH